MKTSTIAGVFLVLAVVWGGWYWLSTTKATPAPAPEPQVTFIDYKNATYTIDGQSVTLRDGVAESPAATSSASQTITQYFGNEATGDLNGDGVPDVAFIVTQDPGGSGTFYYAVAALQGAEGYTGTNAVLLGDRIAPQPTQDRLRAGDI